MQTIPITQATKPYSVSFILKNSPPNRHHNFEQDHTNMVKNIKFKPKRKAFNPHFTKTDKIIKELQKYPGILPDLIIC